MFCCCAEDVVSAVEFDETGDFIAAGDKGGRIVVFERDHVSAVGAAHRVQIEQNANYNTT